MISFPSSQPSILSEFKHVFQHVNSVGMYTIVYDTGTSLAVQVLWHSNNVNLKTWSRYMERLDEDFIERSGTCATLSNYQPIICHRKGHF